MGGNRLPEHSIRTSDNADTRRSRASNDKIVHLKITPDSRLNNEKVEQFAQTLCLYESPLERLSVKDRTFARQNFFSFETVLQREQSYFVLTVPDTMQSITMKAIKTTWPNVTVNAIPDPLECTPHTTASLTLTHHYMFSLRVDRREISLLSSILETIPLLEENDAVYIQTLAVPAEKDWHTGASEAHERFRSGQMPGKFSLTKQAATKSAVKLTAKAVTGTINLVSEFLAGKSAERIDIDANERALMLRDGSLSRETKQKDRGDVYDVCIRVAVSCESPARSKALMRAVTMAFRELDGDNRLVSSASDIKRTWERMKQRKPSFRPQKDYMSIAEVSRLLLMPTNPLQERHKLECIRLPETNIPNVILNGGMRIGDYTFKGVSQPVYMPIDNEDELCLPHIVIGGMGQGKTKGFGANWIVEAVRNGYGALAIDPAKGEIGNEVAAVLKLSDVVRFKLDTIPFALDFCEVKYSKKARNRLANSLISFFNTVTDEAGAQTSRYIRAAVMGMRTGKLSELMRIFEDTNYLAEVIAPYTVEDALKLRRFHAINILRTGGELAVPFIAQ